MSDRVSQITQTVGIIILGIALTLMGHFSRTPGFMDDIWWIPFALGLLLIVVGLVGIGFYASQPNELPCPHCGEKIVARRQGFRDHLHLTRPDEAQAGKQTAEDQAGKHAE
ncbi:MAG: hypothetical protein ACNA7X_04990 [Dehalococcoidia bacterium]